MKKSTAIISIFLAIIMIFTSCGGDKKVDNTDETETTLIETTTETTTKPKYSADEKLIALTFDDGPGGASTNKILDVLSANDSVATFFMVGYAIDEHPETVKRAFDLGCEIGNHTKDHKYLTDLSAADINSQLGYVNNRVKEITGVTPTLCRSPGGFYKGVLNHINMSDILWNIDTNDWKKKDASHKSRTEQQRNSDIQAIVNHVMSQASKGDIILMHDIYNFSADVVAELVPRLKEAGFKLVTISEMFAAYGDKLKPNHVYFSVDFSQPSSTVVLTPGEYTVTTKGSYLNIRSAPDTEGNVVGGLPNGTTVTVTESTEGWAKITYNSVIGWVNANYLK